MNQIVSDGLLSSNFLITSKLQLDFGKFLFGACFGDEKVKPQLAGDIIGQNGSMLLGKGYVLDDKLIQQLHKFEEKIGQPLEIWLAGGK